MVGWKSFCELKIFELFHPKLHQWIVVFNQSGVVQLKTQGDHSSSLEQLFLDKNFNKFWPEEVSLPHVWNYSCISRNLLFRQLPSKVFIARFNLRTLKNRETYLVHTFSRWYFLHFATWSFSVCWLCFWSSFFFVLFYLKTHLRMLNFQLNYIWSIKILLISVCVQFFLLGKNRFVDFKRFFQFWRFNWKFPTSRKNNYWKT